MKLFDLVLARANTAYAASVEDQERRLWAPTAPPPPPPPDPSEAWIVTYWCRCNKPLTMPSAKHGDMLLTGRAWCSRCGYVTKSEARATSEREREARSADRRKLVTP